MNTARDNHAIIGQRSVETGSHCFDVIVVGAGMSGLNAANILHRAGLSVIVLEARNRIGGRIHTTSELGSPVDLGASWIHGTEGNPLMNILPNKRISTTSSTMMFRPDTFELIPQSESDALETKFWGLRERMVETAKRTKLDISLKEFMDRDEIWKHDIEETPLSRLMLPRMVYLLEGIEAASLEVCSIKEFDVVEFGGEQAWLVDGYLPVLEEVAQDVLKARNVIRLGEEVVSIDYSGGHGHPITCTTASGTIYNSQKCLITIPLGVLKAKHHTLFTPPLPQDKQKSIANIGFGTLDKICLRFPHAFWPKEVNFIETFSPTLPEPGLLSFASVKNEKGVGILVGFVSERSARFVETLEDGEIQRIAMDVLKKCFGTTIPEPDDVVVTRWNMDKYSKGSYSHLQVGVSNHEDNDILARPVNDGLFFAGEHTEKNHFATVHGAFLSGQREAERILALLKSRVNDML